MKKLVLITMLAILPAFATRTTAGNLPANYKTVALKAVKEGLKDPDSVKTLRLSSVPPSDVGGLHGVTTCVFAEVNAKNSFGGYTGIVLVGVYFKDGRVVDVATLHGGR
jgi:hypothetical protein